MKKILFLALPLSLAVGVNANTVAEGAQHTLLGQFDIPSLASGLKIEHPAGFGAIKLAQGQQVDY